ncbi:unnamed protein product [Ectocarpus sp. 12 AP-2014]
MSAELYERQMAWKQFISQRSDEQGRAIVSDVYRSSMPDRWPVDPEKNQGRTTQQLLASGTSSSLLATSRSSRSSGKATDMLQNKTLPSMDGCGGAREQHQQQQHRKRQDAASSRHATTTATPAPSYSSMLAARRSSMSSVGVPSQESSRLNQSGSSSVEKTGGLKIANFRSSRHVSSSSKHRVGDDVSRQATARVRAASNTRGRHTPPQAAAGGDKGEPGAIEETATTVTTKKTAAAAAAAAAAATAAAADPPLVLRRAVSAPTKSRAGSSSSSSSSSCGGGGDGNDGEEHARSRNISAVSTAGEAQAAPGAATAVAAAERQRASRQQQRQGSAPLRTSSGRKNPSRVLENRGRRASGNVALVSAGASTAACSAAGTAAAAAAAAAGRTEGISMHSDDGGTGRYRRVVTRRSSDTARPAVDLGQKEQAWKRERAQLLTVIKLQHRQLMMRPSSSSSCSWADASPSGDSVGTTSTAATTAPPAEPASPRSSPCVSSVTPPPLQPRQRHRPSRPWQSLTPPPATREAPIVTSRPPPRTHLLGRVELQREKAAARGVGRLRAGRGCGLASAGSVKSRSDSGSSCPDSSAVAGPTAAPRGFPAESEDGRGGGGSCCDDSGYGGGGGGNAVTVSPSRRCCVEGRLEVMERNVTAVLRRLDDLEKRKSKRGNDDRSAQSTRSDRHVHAV